MHRSTSQRGRFRPPVVAFDIIETVFSLEKLRDRLRVAGAPGDALELWFAHTLRDAFALAATEVYRPFREIASAALANIFLQHGLPPDREKLDGVIAGFAELAPQSDADTAFRRLRDAGVRLVALTNGSAEVTEKLLEGAGLSSSIERVVSVDEVKSWKPRPEAYRHAARCVGVEPEQLALVAAHAWDVHGAGRAGLMTGFVARGRSFPPIMEAPHVVGDTLAEVAAAIAALPLQAVENRRLAATFNASKAAARRAESRKRRRRLS